VTPLRGCFVSGTDTGAGKSVLAAVIAAGLAARGRSVAAFKPVVTGTDEAPDPVFGRDHELLARAAGSLPAAVTPVTYGPPASPHLAARLAGEEIDPQALLAAARAAARGHDTLVAEGVGGLLVPLAGGWDIRRFAAALGLPLVIAARPGLGTINHTLLTLESARAAGLDVAGVVMTPWPAEPSAIELDNRTTVAELGEVDVAVLEPLASSDRAALASAAAALPIDSWVGGTDAAGGRVAPGRAASDRTAV
jgi:dethiobiotin synthetase